MRRFKTSNHEVEVVDLGDHASGLSSYETSSDRMDGKLQGLD